MLENVWAVWGCCDNESEKGVKVNQSLQPYDRKQALQEGWYSLEENSFTFKDN